MSENKIELKLSPKGTPYLDMGIHGRLIFSNATAHPTKGYKWIAYNREFKEIMKMKKIIKGEKIIIEKEVPSRDSQMFRAAKLEDVPRGSIPRKLVDWINKQLAALCVDGYMPRKAIEVLAKRVEKADFKKVMMLKSQMKKSFQYTDRGKYFHRLPD
jgi:hypothetical protein